MSKDMFICVYINILCLIDVFLACKCNLFVKYDSETFKYIIYNMYQEHFHTYILK